LRIEGKVHTISNRGDIVARFPTYIPKHSVVLDVKRKEIGKVSWVFGPVDSPYIEITPKQKILRPLAMIGRSVFVEEEKNE